MTYPFLRLAGIGMRLSSLPHRSSERCFGNHSGPLNNDRAFPDNPPQWPFPCLNETQAYRYVIGST